MGLYSIITKLFQIYMLLIVIWCIMSWIPRSPAAVVPPGDVTLSM